ncbi:ABC transporter permease [Intrasporangium chromatireducens]|uniref:ABC transporter permease n=1 Tax=Intrasporangium chromatireducens TaxID=1386088 RepID=UPI001F0B718B|nr:ABC transporter permease [Intrasporangium chromatireducens]
MTMTDTRRANRRMSRPRTGRPVLRLLSQVGVLGLVLLAWQLYYISGAGSAALNKSPGQVWTAFTALMADGTLASNLWATMQAVIIALLLAGVVGTTIGLALALMPRVEAAVGPMISGLNSMPRVALAPVFIIAFGIGITAKVALAFSVVVFVFLLNARAGVNSADPDIVRLARTMGLSKTQQFFKVLLPIATPSIFAAVRLGLIYSLLGVVTSELITARDGLGQLVAQYSAGFNMAAVYAILIVLAVVAGILNSLTGLAEKWVLRWQAPQGD